MSDNKIHVVHINLKSESDEDIAAACRQLHNYVDTSVIPDGADLIVEDYETFQARGRASDCDCELIQCVCAEARKHDKKCRNRIAMMCTIPIECEHGVDCCPTCDPCTCQR